MTTYRCLYEIDVEADSSEEAARLVHQIMTDPDSMPPVLQVMPWGKRGPDRRRSTLIDLSESRLIDLSESRDGRAEGEEHDDVPP